MQLWYIQSAAGWLSTVIISKEKSSIGENEPMIKTVGLYSLTQEVRTAQGLKEFSEEEYAEAAMVGIELMLEEEKLFNGINPDFAGCHWDSTMVATTKNRIYKISLQSNSHDKRSAKIVLQKTLSSINEEVGKYNEHPFLSSKYIWDTNEGNIILYLMSKFGVHSVNVFFTSSIIREQMLEVTRHR